MASDEIPEGENEQPEIIPKPPSHPITTSLLVTSFFGTILCIGFVWAELFGSYMLGAKTPVETGMEKHTWKEIKDNREGMIDHYGQDFAGEKKDEEMRYHVRQELKLLESQQAEADKAPASTPPPDAPK
jgi:hypothetical protein